MPTQVLLIRHGETEWNKAQRIQGHTNIPLSLKGEQQAAKLGLRLKKIPLHAAYSSDLSRAYRTAEIALGPKADVVRTADLRERCFGQWEGRRWPEIETMFPSEAKQFHEDPIGFQPPCGETWNQMQTRVFQKIEDIAARHPNQTVAVFAHGGPCKAALLAALNLPALQWRFWVAANASLHRLVRLNGRTGGAWQLTGFNDVAHLEESDIMADPSAGAE